MNMCGFVAARAAMAMVDARKTSSFFTVLSPVPENEYRDDVNGDHGEHDGDHGHVDDTPALKGFDGDGVPVLFHFEFVGVGWVDAELLDFFFYFFSEPVDEVLADVTAAGDEHHEGGGHPWEDGVEVDTGVYEYHECAEPTGLTMEFKKEFESSVFDELLFSC